MLVVDIGIVIVIIFLVAIVFAVTVKAYAVVNLVIVLSHSGLGPTHSLSPLSLHFQPNAELLLFLVALLVSTILLILSPTRGQPCVDF